MVMLAYMVRRELEEGVERSERDGGRGLDASEDVVRSEDGPGGSAPYSGAERNVFEAAGRAGRDVAGHRTCEFGHVRTYKSLKKEA